MGDLLVATGLVLLLLVILSLVAKIFQWLWNTTMPQVFGLRVITYWQAVRLLIISGFLFGGVHYASQSSPIRESSVIEAKLDRIIQKLDTLNKNLTQHHP